MFFVVSDAICDELRITPKRSDILMEIFGLGWLPHWVCTVDGQTVELPAYVL